MRSRRVILLMGAVGAALGVLLLHPLTMVVYWFELRAQLGTELGSLRSFIGQRLTASFTVPMLPMTLGFASIGAGLGALFAALSRRWSAKEHERAVFARELSRDIPSLIREGESERLEFKAALRWDRDKGRVNKLIELATLKTIAAFANADGGNLLLGVNDNGEAVGLGRDYKTLRRRDRDGFEQYIFTLISQRIGGDVCPFVHVMFATVDEQDVVRVVVEAAPHPVYVTGGAREQFFLRAGNTTRELGVREAVQYISARWPRLRRAQSAPPGGTRTSSGTANQPPSSNGP